MSYVYRDGSRLTPWMLHCITQADAAFKAQFGCELLVTSGIRTHQEQIDIFLSKYRVQWVGNGPYGDVRWWKGKRYVRHVGGGTVAAPGKSNHEIQGDTAAADLRDSGTDPGVTRAGTARANWLRKHGSRFGLEPEGYGFGEPWHVRIRGIYRTPPTAPAVKPTPKPVPVIVPEEEDDDMPQIIRKKNTDEVTLLDPDVGRDLARRGHGNGKPEMRSEKTTKGVVNTYRGFMVTTDPDVAATWGRSYCRAYGNAPQDRADADYRLAQAEASRLSFEKHG